MIKTLSTLRAGAWRRSAPPSAGLGSALAGLRPSRELRLLAAWMAPHQRAYLVGALALAISDVGQLASFHLVGRTIDALRAGTLGQAGLWVYILGLLACAIGVAATRYVWRLAVHGSARRIEADLRARFFNHLQTLSMGFFVRQKVGQLMAHATNDVQTVRLATSEGVILAVDALFFTAGAALMMLLTVDARLGVAAMLPLVLIPVISRHVGLAVRRRYAEVQAAFAAMSEQAQETIAGIRVIKGFTAQPRQEERFREANAGYRERYVRMMTVEILTDRLVTVLVGLSVAIGIVYGGALVLDGTISLGQYVAFNGYLGLLIWPLMCLGWTLNIFQRTAASVARLEAIFQVAPEAPHDAGAVALPTVRGHLVLQGLSFRYAPDLPLVLSGLTLDLAPGSVVGVVGGTGAGKSTLANLLVRLFNPSWGQAFLDGHDLNTLALADLRRAIAYVPQDPFLFARTIRENIAFDSGCHDPAAIEEAARLAHIHDEIVALPDGYDTVLGENGASLSGGQRQRIGIARALLKRSRLLVFDDCLSAVDAATEAAIVASLRAFMRGRTTLVISHRVAAIAHADEILVLEAGSVAERGTHAQLVARGGHYARLHERQRLEAAIATL